MKNIIIGTAGHIDHGKTTLIKALTGRNTDRWEEEQRRDVKDERVIQMIKRYLKSGVMENGVVVKTEEGSPQGGNLSPLLANVYLNEFDQ